MYRAEQMETAHPSPSHKQLSPSKSSPSRGTYASRACAVLAFSTVISSLSRSVSLSHSISRSLSPTFSPALAWDVDAVQAAWGSQCIRTAPIRISRGRAPKHCASTRATSTVRAIEELAIMTQGGPSSTEGARWELVPTSALLRALPTSTRVQDRDGDELKKEESPIYPISHTRALSMPSSLALALVAFTYAITFTFKYQRVLPPAPASASTVLYTRDVRLQTHVVEPAFLLLCVGVVFVDVPFWVRVRVRVFLRVVLRVDGETHTFLLLYGHTRTRRCVFTRRRALAWTHAWLRVPSPPSSSSHLASSSSSHVGAQQTQTNAHLKAHAQTKPIAWGRPESAALRGGEDV
ncbi:hypothetical protein B0H13DRAFT_2679992 [Mycena leptocephala]|nr:hypothetical protein B0H13DRAFT_2679992 [Mycena leptocephala]